MKKNRKHHPILLKLMAFFFSLSPIPRTQMGGWAEWIQNPFRITQFQGNKNTELDILYTDELGRLIQFEMQTTVNAGLEKRMSLNQTQLYSRQLKTGDDFTHLKAVVSSWLVDENLYVHPEWLHVFRYYCSEHNLDFNGDLRIIALELPKWLAGFTQSNPP